MSGVQCFDDTFLMTSHSGTSLRFCRDEYTEYFEKPSNSSGPSKLTARVNHGTAVGRPYLSILKYSHHKIPDFPPFHACDPAQDGARVFEEGASVAPFQASRVRWEMS